METDNLDKNSSGTRGDVVTENSSTGAMRWGSSKVVDRPKNQNREVAVALDFPGDGLLSPFREAADLFAKETVR